MAKKYSRVTLAERKLIAQHLSDGKSPSWIANAIGRDKSTISREIQKGSSLVQPYSFRRAQNITDRLKTRNRRSAKIQGALESAVLWYLLELQCSPTQIVGRLKREYPTISELQVSHETIYKYVYSSPLRDKITSSLRRSRKKRRRKKAPNRGGIRNKLPISKRPDLSNREEFGHWEGDLIVGKEHQSAMATLVERSSRYTIIIPLEAKDSNSVVNAITSSLEELPPHLLKSLTYDQCSEMAEHSRLT